MVSQELTAGSEVKGCIGPRLKHVVVSSFDSPGNPHYNGGGAAVVEMIARRLTERYEVTVVTASRRAETVERNGVRYTHLPVSWAGPRAGQLLFHALLPFMARKIPHDLWIESFTPPFSTSFTPLFSRARVAGFAQTLSGEQMSRLYKVPFFLIERLGLRFYRHVLVLNDADAEKVRRFSPSATVRMIPNGIDLPELEPKLIGRGSYILFLGRIDMYHKGLDMLLTAYRQSGLSIPLLIAGAGTDRDERKLAALADASDDLVRWVGHVEGERKQQLLKECAFLVLPSRYETFGLVALEAMSYGKPVIHFDLPALRWIEGSVQVASFDVNAFATEMRAMADDEATRFKLGCVGQTAAQQYGRDKAADRHLAFVRDLLDEHTDTCLEGRDTACQ